MITICIIVVWLGWCINLGSVHIRSSGVYLFTKRLLEQQASHHCVFLSLSLAEARFIENYSPRPVLVIRLICFHRCKSVYLSVYGLHMNVYSFIQLPMCADMPLPTVAVRLLEKPIGIMLMMHDFMREKEGRVKGRESQRRKWEPRLQSDTFPQSLYRERSTCLFPKNSGWRITEPDFDHSVFLLLVSKTECMWAVSLHLLVLLLLPWMLLIDPSEGRWVSQGSRRVTSWLVWI